MIIFKDLITDNEVFSDAYDIKDVGNGIWESDLQQVTVGGEAIQLAGANASAEGEDADDTEDAAETKLNIVRDFQLDQFPPASDKKSFQADLKTYIKALMGKLKEKGTSDEDMKKFQGDAAAYAKKVSANYSDYDLYVNNSEGEGQKVLVNYREDGVTPFATLFKWGLYEYKV